MPHLWQYSQVYTSIAHKDLHNFEKYIAGLLNILNWTKHEIYYEPGLIEFGMRCRKNDILVDKEL